MTLGDLIKEYREKANMSMDEFAERANLSKGYISMLEKNINPKTGQPIAPSLQTIKQVSSALHMDFEVVISAIDQDIDLRRTDVLPAYPGLIPIETKKVPLLGTMACGEPVYRDEDFESYVAIGNDVRADAAVRAEGDSMIGARILNGDIVFVRYQPSVENGEIAALWVDDGFTIKRFYQYDGVLVLHSENPNYKDMVFRESDCKNIKILGKAVAFQSDVK